MLVKTVRKMLFKTIAIAEGDGGVISDCSQDSWGSVAKEQGDGVQ